MNGKNTHIKDKKLLDVLKQLKIFLLFNAAASGKSDFQLLMKRNILKNYALCNSIDKVMLPF